MARSGVRPHPKLWDAVNSLQALGYGFPGRATRKRWGLKVVSGVVILVRRHTRCVDIMRIDKGTGYCEYSCRLPV